LVEGCFAGLADESIHNNTDKNYIVKNSTKLQNEKAGDIMPALITSI